MTVPEVAVSPALDDLVTAWGLLSEATVAVGRRLAVGLETAGEITLPEFDVLIRLHREPSHRLPMTRIADDVGLSSGGFTKLADRLEHAELITRRRAVDDRRVVYAVLTERGSHVTTTALTRHHDDLRRTLLAPLGSDGLYALIDLTRTLRDHNR